jgi:hypothetical protein
VKAGRRQLFSPRAWACPILQGEEKVTLHLHGVVEMEAVGEKHDRNLLAQQQVVGEVDLPHAAFAEGGNDSIACAEGRPREVLPNNTWRERIGNAWSHFGRSWSCRRRR